MCEDVFLFNGIEVLGEKQLTSSMLKLFEEQCCREIFKRVVFKFGRQLLITGMSSHDLVATCSHALAHYLVPRVLFYADSPFLFTPKYFQA